MLRFGDINVGVVVVARNSQVHFGVHEEVERQGGHAQKMLGKNPRSMGAWSTGDGGPIDHRSHLRENPKGNPVA